ncbi:MAG: hypothetical protein KDA61_18540, partial [Planctomycetales bacterium]|nr:hypothetical protein [Planctomycetales bacterium]
DTDGELRFNSPFTMSGGTLANNGLVVFNNNATIEAGANFTMPTSNSSITVGAGRSVTVNQANFNADGNGSPTNVLTIEDDGNFHLNLGAGGDTSIGSQVVLKGGALIVQPSTGSWSIDGDISVPNGFSASVINGSPVTLTSVTTNIVGDELLNFVPTTTFGLGASFSGDGNLMFSGQVNVANATAINMSGGSVDLDGADNVGDFINVDAPLVIKAATLAPFGKFNGGGGVNTIDVDARTAGTNGKLTINLDGANANWALNSQGVLNLAGPNGGATMLEGSDVVLNGIVNATGGAFITARVQVGGAVNINAGCALTFAGGSFANPNRLNGGIVNGPGNFFSGGSTATLGFGTINAEVNFVGNGRLLADDGVLTINGPILSAGGLGTADDDGILNVVNSWSTSTTSAVSLQGGQLKGGTVTNSGLNGINGFGLVSSRVINSSKVVANAPGKTLVLETAANDNDWDGGADNGSLRAVSGGVLELRDTATFGFGGTVSMGAGSKVFANGFAFNFNPGSTLELQGGTYETTNSTDVGGFVTTSASSESLIQVEVNRFLTFQSTSVATLTQNLTLDNNNITIQAGATFSGAGAVIIPDGSHLVVNNSASVGVLLVNEGAFRPSGFFTPGSVTVKDYSQTASGELVVDLSGSLLNQFDRLLVNGNAQLNGHLTVDLLGGFDPAVGTTFDLISTGFGVSGQFNGVDYLNLPADKAFELDYLANTVR